MVQLISNTSPQPLNPLPLSPVNFLTLFYSNLPLLPHHVVPDVFSAHAQLSLYQYFREQGNITDQEINSPERGKGLN